MSARYLLRFDDICPTMNWDVWDQIDAILSAEGVTPILAVIPDNQDQELKVSPPNQRFWDRARDWQARGWTIGMHGYEHRFVTNESGILRVNRFSEFAGLPAAEQERKLRAGLSVLHGEGVHPAMWIAPAHSFDDVTLQALQTLGLTHLSDGFSLLPHVDHFGITWIPQQLWSFRWRPFGVWTICFHLNRWKDQDILEFRENIKRYRASISNVREVLAVYHGRRNNVLDSVFQRSYRTASIAFAPLRSFLGTFRQRPIVAERSV